MDYIKTLKDSITTSTIGLEFFKDKEESAYWHIYKSKFKKFPMKLFNDNNVNNFNSNRLQKTASKAYPKNDRPRGKKDLESVNYWKKQKDIPAIWILKKNNEYILLDGAHRIVANYIKGDKYINSYVINY